MSGKTREDGVPGGTKTGKRKVPPLLLVVAWLVPGLGHYLLGKRRRALVFSLVVVACFVTGVLVDGELGIPRESSPFSWLAAIACCGNGVLYFARLLWLNGLDVISSSVFPYGLQGGGDPVAPGFAYGNTFLYTAGLMNLLTVLDALDIARDEKS